MKKRIRVLAVIVTLVMVFGMLAACNGGSGDDDTSSAPPSNESSQPSQSSAPPSQSSSQPSAQPPQVAQPAPEGEIENIPTGELGMFDPNYDYFANPTYTMHFVVHTWSGLLSTFHEAFTHWATLANVNYSGYTEFGGDGDAFLTQLPILAQQYDGLVVDSEQTMWPRTKEVLIEAGATFAAAMAIPTDMSQPGNPLIMPYVGYDSDVIGRQFPEHLIGNALAMWPNVPLSEYGWITVDHSVIPALHERTLGAYYALEENPEWKATFIDSDRYFVADTSISWFDVDTSIDVVTPILATNPHIERWLVFGLVDSQAQGAAIALDNFGLADGSWASSFGAEAARLQWDAGQTTAYRSAGTSATMIFGEPIFFALYAYLRGYTTPEEIWPEWVNPAHGGVYANRIIPFFWIDQDNYQIVYAWGDLYADSNLFPQYAEAGRQANITRNSFDASVPIPPYVTGRGN